MKKIIVGKNWIVGPWVAERTRGRYSIPLNDPTIGLAEDGRLIGGVTYTGFNGANIQMHSACLEGHEGIWLNREFLCYVFWYPFMQLNCKRVTACVAASNDVALDFDTKLGFVHEATLKDALPDGDMLILRMMKEDCRWLKLGERYGRFRQRGAGQRD